MTDRSLTPTPANLPTSPETFRSYARVTRPILTLSGPRTKTAAEIAHAAAREIALLQGTLQLHPASASAANPRNPGPYGGKPHPARPRAQFALVPPT